MTSTQRRPPAIGALLALLVGAGAVWGVGWAQDGAESASGKGAAWAAGEIKRPAAPAVGTPLLLLEPRSMGSEVAVLVPGARKTVFSAGYQGKLGVRHYSRTGFRETFPDGWKPFYKRGVEAAAEHLKSLKPKLVRDRKKVVQYALIQSDHPLTPLVILSPGFAEMFTDTLGEQLLIVIPDRTTVVVFPKLANTLEDQRAGLADLYDDAIYPVSEEVFELTKDGIRAVGAFRSD